MTDNPDKVHPGDVLLSEGLDLCVRARKLEAKISSVWADSNKGGSAFNCSTPALWVVEQYEKDLADWESRARKYLTERSLP